MFRSKAKFKESFLGRMERRGEDKSDKAAYLVLAEMVREFVAENWEITNRQYETSGKKQLYYISIEFLIGRMLDQNLLNLKMFDLVEESLHELGYKLTNLENYEPEPGLGNGGLGRLAACFMDSLASLELPGHGYGIRYKGGLFTQHFIDGFQTEQPTDWITGTDDWDVRREDLAVEIPFFGTVHLTEDTQPPQLRVEGAEWVKAVPYDMPIVGANGCTVNTLRLWQAEASEQPLPPRKSIESYMEETKAISDRLYPDDALDEGKILRLKQQYLLCSASLQTILKNRSYPIQEMPKHVAIQVNDTHPALAVPELMRILMDLEGLGWDEAWEITSNTISYTNHTILAEAMEKWEIRLLQPLLPRVYMIIAEIDRRFKERLAPQYLSNEEFDKLSIIESGVVKMANLAVVGSYRVNGVAGLHTRILKKRELREMYEQFPEKFHNKTNGITHRRWLMKANPELCMLINGAIGSDWHRKPENLRHLNRFIHDPAFLEDFQGIKRLKKVQLIEHMKDQQHIQFNVDPDSIFDMQIKRFHGYKRQLMNIIHIQILFDKIKEDSSFRPYPRTFFFGGKAAPSYTFAKQVIKLINAIADRVHGDELVRKHINIVFIEDYNVTHAEKMIPAADVSEQISTASKEASGTGNMKFMMNGALTLGTNDGANVEIFQQVGEENAFKFGQTSEQIMKYEKEKTYRSEDVYDEDRDLELVMELLYKGELSGGKENVDYIIKQLIDDNDPYFVLKDMRSYEAAHDRVLEAYDNKLRWQGMCVKNIAESGIFSSDRTIQQYADEVWKLEKISCKTEVKR